MAVRETSKVLQTELSKAITDNVWDWPRGESPRDIVDTGELLEKQLVESVGNTITYKCTAKHAKVVRSGAVLRNGTVLPGRDWVARAFKKKVPHKVLRIFLNNHIR